MSEFESICSVFSLLPDAVVVVDRHHRICYCNGLAESLFGYPAGEIIFRPLSILVPPRFQEAHARHMAAFREASGKRPMSNRPLLVGVARTGDEVPISASLCTFEAGGEHYQAAVVQDQRAVASSLLKMIAVAETDALTEIGNRRYFMGRLARTAESEAPFSLLYLDLDGFKDLNDQYGHALGDAVLRVVASRLQSSLRRRDSCARLGGDEFVAMLEGVGDAATLTPIARKIWARIGQSMNIDGHLVTVGVSIGALACRGPQSEAAVLGAADGLMYRAKEVVGTERLVVEEWGPDHAVEP